MEWVVIVSLALMDQRHLSDGTGCHDVVRCSSHLQWWSSHHLGHVTATLTDGASTVGVVACCPALIVVRSGMARMCLILSAVNFGTVPPNTLRRSTATAMERS